MPLQCREACSYWFWFHLGNITWWEYAVWECTFQVEPWDDSITRPIRGNEKWNLGLLCKVITSFAWFYSLYNSMYICILFYHIKVIGVVLCQMNAACVWRDTLLPADIWMGSSILCCLCLTVDCLALAGVILSEIFARDFTLRWVSVRLPISWEMSAQMRTTSGRLLAMT